MELDEKETRREGDRECRYARLSPATTPRAALFSCETSKSMGYPSPHLGELAFLWSADEPATYPNAGTIRRRPVHSHP